MDTASNTGPSGPRPAGGNAVPRALWLGVIVWSDDPEVEPTVIVDRSPVTLARAVAVAIHDMLEDSAAYAGATGFLESNPPPQEWVLPEDVDAWLEALREATPHPSFSFHHVPTTGGVDGTNHTVVDRFLQQALQERQKGLTPDTTFSGDESPPASHHITL